ncbi:hypothetical protein ACH52_1630 [Eubacterium limosum]|nr:hypothetical protein ACH52_1630 [Eubacterium limosum]
MKILVITDNARVLKEKKNLDKIFDQYGKVAYCYSDNNLELKKLLKKEDAFFSIDLKNLPSFIFDFDLIISWHCKQLFPKTLIQSVRCINIHPGYNPYNRGWFPQVFSILNKKPCGVTIHEIDEHLDHGKIIAQKEVSQEKYYTSKSFYDRIIETEFQLFRECADKILTGNYQPFFSHDEGNLNLKSDFDQLLKIDLNEVGTFESFIDRLRALTFEGYDNAYFFDGKGKKIYVELKLKCSDNDS